ncbi:MAG: hypothetical protein B6I24_06675 [Bacteroidetes bacterium 4572_128]|nr:MAG: hypothetical protein B6I24_06675 [Bacteroidetes bacterium 4572_128]
MDNKILLDTSILIDYFRKKNKKKTAFVKLAKNFQFSISVITKLEIIVGAKKSQKDIWDKIFEKITIIPINEKEIDAAIKIIQELRKKNKMIDLADILIAANHWQTI